MKPRQPGIYVERVIRGTVDEVWMRTQRPEVHLRWDLRFTEITYLPKLDPASAVEPQRFLYATRVGFGLGIEGTGESVGTRIGEDGNASSALKFASEDWLSLISTGSGYWRYIPVNAGQMRFLTWYDYEVRFGVIGRLVDRLVFRPLMGWATAWSFDRLALWVEQGQTPELSLALAMIYAMARLSVAFVWIWHGLVPKIFFHDVSERLMLAQAGLPSNVLPWFGLAEILIGLAMLILWRMRTMFLLTAAAMVAALLAAGLRSPEFLTAAFNPVTLNLLMVTVCIIGYMAAPYVPTATRCLRVPAKVERGGKP